MALGKRFALKLTAVLSDLWPSHLPCTMSNHRQWKACIELACVINELVGISQG